MKKWTSRSLRVLVCWHLPRLLPAYKITCAHTGPPLLLFHRLHYISMDLPDPQISPSSLRPLAGDPIPPVRLLLSTRSQPRPMSYPGRDGYQPLLHPGHKQALAAFSSICSLPHCTPLHPQHSGSPWRLDFSVPPCLSFAVSPNPLIKKQRRVGAQKPPGHAPSPATCEVSFLSFLILAIDQVLEAQSALPPNTASCAVLTV